MKIGWVGSSRDPALDVTRGDGVSQISPYGADRAWWRRPADRTIIDIKTDTHGRIRAELIGKLDIAMQNQQNAYAKLGADSLRFADASTRVENITQHIMDAIRLITSDEDLRESMRIDVFGVDV
jgi:hypothetical protein